MTPQPPASPIPHPGRPAALLDTRVVYRGHRRAWSNRDNLEHLAMIPD